MKHALKKILFFLIVTSLFIPPSYSTLSCGCTSGSCKRSCSSGSCSNTCSNSSDSCSGYCDTCCDDSDCNKHDVYCKSHFSPRSQGLDTARWLVGNHGIVHEFDTDELYGDFTITAAFTRSFNPEKIGRFFTPRITSTTDCCDTGYINCNSCCNANCFTLGADANEITEAQAAEINGRAQDFGLNGTGTACLYPRVSNFIVDFNLYVGLAEFIKGLFLEIHAPLVHTWWDPHCYVCEEELCSDTFDTCQMSTTDSATKNNVGTTSLKKALRGDFKWGDVLNELKYGQICSGRQTRTRVADLHIALGYEVYNKEWYRIAPKFVFAAPTGNKPKAKYMFEPIVGNGGHWELGGGLSAHAILWERDADRQFGFYLEGYAAHMFKSRCHKRTFDLCNNGCFSRYLLLKKFTKQKLPTDDRELEGLERGPNVLTQDVKATIDIQGDVSAMFSLQYDKWNIDLGYNFWGRTKEKLKVCCCIPENRYGIKGTLPVCTNGTGSASDQNVQTASTSTIAKSAGTLGTSDGTDRATDQVFISCADINCYSATHPSAFSHAIFFHLNSTWENDNDLTPFFGIGGKVEWSGRGNRALDQWALWTKGGLVF